MPKIKQIFQNDLDFALLLKLLIWACGGSVIDVVEPQHVQNDKIRHLGNDTKVVLMWQR